MTTTALGLIEVRGYVGAIEACDAALKAANVTLLNVEKIRGGYVTVKLNGDVAAVRAAVDAGTAAAEKCSQVLSSHVIARIHEETLKIIEQPKQQEIPLKVDEEKDATVKETNVEEPKVIETPASLSDEKEVEKSTEVTKVQETAKVSYTLSKNRQDLESLSVEELRKLCRSAHLEGVTPKEIKFGRKDFLIKLITDHHREEEHE